MVTCPWCGTNYQSFQPNCTNCGGPLPANEEKGLGLIVPPPAPRPISQTYLWRLLFSDGWGISAFVLGILGGVFTLVGGGLSSNSITAFVGIPFAVGGLPVLVAGIWIFIRRYQEMQRIVSVLREGQAALGQITDVEANYSVEINGQTPWNIRYKFKVIG